MDRLSPEHRTVLELVFTENYGYAEVAVILGCPVNTVKTRIFHARKKLADLLAKRGYSPYDLQEGL
jgi:RNA polymerase sigma-70 factor (ECF subfamily)